MNFSLLLRMVSWQQNHQYHYCILAYYHNERNRQTLSRAIPFPGCHPGPKTGPIIRSERLKSLLTTLTTVKLQAAEAAQGFPFLLLSDMASGQHGSRSVPTSPPLPRGTFETNVFVAEAASEPASLPDDRLR